jgi:hypothetical protein
MQMSKSALERARELIRQQNSNQLNASQSLNVYGISDEKEQEKELTSRERFQKEREEERQRLQSIQESFQQPTQSIPTEQNLGILRNVGESLYKGVAAGTYEFAETYTFGALGLAEAGIKDVGVQKTIREYQEEDLFAKVLGEVGTGAGYLVGAPVKLTSLALGKGSTVLASKLFGKQTTGSAVKNIVNAASKQSKLPKSVRKELSDEVSKVVTKTASSVGIKTSKASNTFATSFAKNINSRIEFLRRSGQITSAQAVAMRDMAKVVGTKGVPVQTLQTLAKSKFGEGFAGRFMGEFLEDAFVFSIADGVMSVSRQAQEVLKGESDSIKGGFNFLDESFLEVGSVAREMVFGFAAGTAINAAASYFKPLNKFMKSRVDFGQGIRGLLSKNNYKGKDLKYLTKKLIFHSEQNKYNNFSTKLVYTKDGVKDNIDLYKFAKGNDKLTEDRLYNLLRQEFGDDAENQAIKWLMSNKKKYSKEILKEARKEGFENYKRIFPRMMVTGAAMSGTQLVQMNMESEGEYDFDPTDFIASFIIGGFTMRRGNFGKIDIDTKINKLRHGLEHLGIKSENTFYSSTLSGGNERFGVGLLRDNQELTDYLKEQGIVSDDDESITNRSLTEDERSFYNFDTAEPTDPYNNRMNVLHGLMDSDYKYVRTLDQISDKQASKIISILENQGFKTIEDFHQAVEDRVDEATQGMEENLSNVLKNINNANHEEFKVKENESGITIPANVKISNELLEKASKGDFKEWLSGKEGNEAEEELYGAIRSLETVIAVTEGLGASTFDQSQSVNKIESVETLKSIYDIVKREESNIDQIVSNNDGRSNFKFTELESYILPMMRNIGNNNTKKIMSVLSEKNMDSKLMSLFLDSGILVKDGDDIKLINDYKDINTSDDASKIDLGKIHGILKSLGEFKITEVASKDVVQKTQFNSLKNQLNSLGVKVDLLNRPNMEFMYQLVLNDINKLRLKNLVIDPADVDFIVRQSGNKNFSIPGVLDDKGIRNFILRTVSIPSDLELQNRYNGILSRLESKVVNVLTDSIQLDKEDANILRNELNFIYKKDRQSDNIQINKLFELMSNTKLSGVKDQMIEHIKSFGDNARIDILNMLKQQNIIKRDSNGDLEIIENNLTIEKFELIKDNISRAGLPSEIVQRNIDKRREIRRKYIKDSSDVIDEKNASLSLDSFFSRYKFKVTLSNGAVNYESHANKDNVAKKEFFDKLIFEENKKAIDGEKVDELRLIDDESIKRISEQIVTNKNVEFNKLDKTQKDKVIQDIQQIAFGSKDRVAVRKISIRNNDLSIDENKELMQNNPVHKYFNGLIPNYGIFDNTVVYTEFNRAGNLIEKSYNILQTKNIPKTLVSTINATRDRVERTLANKNLNSNDVISSEPNDIGIKKLDVYDGMDSILINTSDQQKIVDDFYRFHKEHIDNVDRKTKVVLDNIKKSFDETDEIYKYNDEKIEHATRFLIFEVGFKSKDNELFYSVLNETDPRRVDKYIKRLKLITTKNFVRPTTEYIKSVQNARKKLLGENDNQKVEQGKVANVSTLIRKRLKKKGHNVVIWDDVGTESMSQIIQDLKNEYPEYENIDLENTIGKAHSDVSGFDSISFISESAMSEYHSYLGHSPNSRNPIKPVISSQGKDKTLLYGKTLFVYSPALDGFFKNNPTVDILITKSGAKAYDGIDDATKDSSNLITGKRFNELNVGSYSDLIKTIDIDALGLRPQKDANLLSASVSDADYNYMNNAEHEAAFAEISEELDLNLQTMIDIVKDPYKMNAFMRTKMEEGKIPEDSQEGSLQNLSNLMYYLKLSESSDPTDYSINQVQKYLAKEYIDTIFSDRRAIVNRIYNDIETESYRYGGQAELVVSGKSHLGENRNTRLLPTLFNPNGEMVVRGQIMLPFKEKDSKLSELGTKKIRIVQNDRILNIKEFADEVKSLLPEDDLKYLEENAGTIENMLSEDATLGSSHDLIEYVAEATNTRYEIGIISRRNPRTRPNDITLLGLKGFLDEKQGLGVEINSFDVANVYEGDYDADKVDYFFAHDDYMFDYIKRNQSYFVQGIDPSDLQGDPNFTFQMESSASRDAVLSKIGSSISYKQGIGIVQKTPRKINYLQNLGSNEYLFDEDQREPWEDHTRTNPFTGELIGPSLLYKSGEGEFVTVDTETLAYFQRAALEVQYIVDGSNQLNRNIASDIYNWTDDFLFPKNSRSLSPKQANAKNLKEIIENGQTADGKRVRIFQKFTLDKESNKYKTTKELNESDKLIIKEFLNQQNKLLNAFGDQTYTEGSPRKSTFYDLYNGSNVFRAFHKDIYKGLERALFYKKNPLPSGEKNYLKEILNPDNQAFQPIQSNIQDIYDGNGGGYLDRMAVQISKSEFMEDKKQYNLDIETYTEVDNWFNSFLGDSPNDDGDYKDVTSDNMNNFITEINTSIESNIDKKAKKVVKDTKRFNSYISTIKRLDKKKDFIEKSSYHWKWKNHKIKALDYVINKFQEKVKNEYGKNIKKLDPRKLDYKKYVSIEDSGIVKSVIHKHSLNAFLKTYGPQYDSWTETLGDSESTARKDLQSIKDFNAKVLGGNTLLDDILPNNKNTIIQDNKMFKFVQDHKTDISNVWELRQKYLLNKINQHGINFLYAYMEPIRDNNSIGVFNNRPVAIPYKESKRYTHGIQLLTAMAKGDNKLYGMLEKDELFDTSYALQAGADLNLRKLLEANEHYRRFFEKDTELMDLANPLVDRYTLMGFGRAMEKRLNTNNDFNWSSQLLASDPLATINKSTIEVYRDFVETYTDRSNEDFIKFVEDLNDLDEFSARNDYVNPIRYMKKRLDLDEGFRKLSKDNVYNVVGPDGSPSNLLDSERYLGNKFFKFKPKLVKTDKKLISMLKNMREMKDELNRTVRENPSRDKGYETIRALKEIRDCQ